MRTLLFTGPGGAGTTTVAAAAAVRSARSGARTLLLARHAPSAAGLDGVEGLTVEVVDPQRALEDLWARHVEAVAEVLPQLTLPPATSVVPLPGTEELALLAALARAGTPAEGDDSAPEVVVVDAGPLDRSAALLALPAALRWWLDQLLTPRMRALAAVRTAALAAGAVRRGAVDVALDAVPAVERLLAGVTLDDPARTRVAFVSTAARDAVPALRAAATTLGLHGLRASTVLVRVMPGGPGEWWARRVSEQEAVLPELGAVAEVVRLPELPVAPADADELAELLPARGLFAAAVAVPPGPERVETGGRKLTVPLPFARRGAVDLTRWADDLVVTAGGVRRSLRLDALLRRCLVTGGRLADPGTAAARLEVTFVPDPGQWPADLMAAEGAPS